MTNDELIRMLSGVDLSGLPEASDADSMTTSLEEGSEDAGAIIQRMMAECRGRGEFVVNGLNLTRSGPSGPATERQLFDAIMSIAGWVGWDERDKEQAGGMVAALILTDDRRKFAIQAWENVKLRDELAAAKGKALIEGVPSGFSVGGGAIEDTKAQAAWVEASQMSRSLWRVSGSLETWRAVGGELARMNLTGNPMPMPCGCDPIETTEDIMRLGTLGEDAEPRFYTTCSYTAFMLMLAAGKESPLELFALGSGLGLPTFETMMTYLGESYFANREHVEE